jgi:hypothetical protein
VKGVPYEGRTLAQRFFDELSLVRTLAHLLDGKHEFQNERRYLVEFFVFSEALHLGQLRRDLHRSGLVFGLHQ